MNNSEYIEKKKLKYGKCVIAEKYNFIFLNDGSMVYDSVNFYSFEDAVIDAVKNHGESLEELVNLIYQEKVDQPIVKQKFLKILENI